MQNEGDSEVKTDVWNPKLPIIKIPKQDFKLNKVAARPLLDKEIVDGLQGIFKLFAVKDRVNPYQIKDGLRLVGFHKEQPHIYKLIEDLCLQYDMNERNISFQDFIDFLNEHLGENSTRPGINKIFLSLMDLKAKEITPETLQKAIEEMGDELSVEDVKYILEVISAPSTDINVTADETYYIMTKKPADVNLFTTATKSIK